MTEFDCLCAKMTVALIYWSILTIHNSYLCYIKQNIRKQ